MKYVVIAACALVLVPVLGCPPPQPRCGTEPWVFDGEEFEDTTAAQFCLEWRALIDPAQADLAQQGILEYCKLVDDCELTTQQFYDICQLSHAEKLEVFDVDAYCFGSEEGQTTPDFAARRAAFAATAEGTCPETAMARSAAVAECADGVRAVIDFDGFHYDMTFHDADSGAFVARLSWIADAPIPPCCGLFWWPARLNCPEVTVTEVLCGDFSDVGTALNLDR